VLGIVDDLKKPQGLGQAKFAVQAVAACVLAYSTSASTSSRPTIRRDPDGRLGRGHHHAYNIIDIMDGLSPRRRPSQRSPS